MEPGEITSLLHRLRQGDNEAAAELIPLVYGELFRLATVYMRRERPEHTLEATALVNEVYLKVVAQSDRSFENRAHFFGVAASVMRHILVDYARGRQSAKRGGDVRKLPLDEALIFSEQQSHELVALDDALERLAKLNPRQARIVELRFFVGLSIEEASTVLGLAARTVNREWSVAQAWLRREMSA